MQKSFIFRHRRGFAVFERAKELSSGNFKQILIKIVLSDRFLSTRRKVAKHRISEFQLPRDITVRNVTILLLFEGVSLIFLGRFSTYFDKRFQSEKFCTVGKVLKVRFPQIFSKFMANWFIYFGFWDCSDRAGGATFPFQFREKPGPTL